MAYLRKEQETVEIDYSLEKVWKKIPKALEELEWTIEEVDETAHHAKAKTPQGFVLWSSALFIHATRVDDKKTRVSVVAETPFTTISAIVDLGRARKRIDLFFVTLANQLTPNHDAKSSSK